MPAGSQIPIALAMLKTPALRLSNVEHGAGGVAGFFAGEKLHGRGCVFGFSETLWRNVAKACSASRSNTV